MAYCPPRSRLLAWLTAAVDPVPADIGASLIRSFFTQPSSLIMGSVGALMVSGAAAVRTGQFFFYAIALLEVTLLALRLVLLRQLWRAEAEDRDAETGLCFAAGLLWTALVGVTVGAVFLMTDDHFLMVMSSVTMMGIIGGIVTRNSSTPRLALAQVVLCKLPFQIALCLRGDPWLLLMVMQFPLFLVSLKQTVYALHRNYVAVRLAERDSEIRATHDALTGLWNRPGLMSALTRCLCARDGLRQRLVLLFLDLDGFKAVNDLHGHAAGDRILREVAGRLKECLPPNSLVARLGGDEFVALVPDAGAGEAASISERAIAAVSLPFDLDDGGSTAGIGVSIGIACAEPGQAAEQLLADADAALYRAKAAGKGRFIMARPLAIAA